MNETRPASSRAARGGTALGVGLHAGTPLGSETIAIKERGRIGKHKDGSICVNSGFEPKSMRFDVNLLFNPPPNFLEVPQPVVTHNAPVFFMRKHAR